MVPKSNTPKSPSVDGGRNHTEKPLVKNENGPEVVAGRTGGLCKDCEKRVTCELPIRQEGIWRCRDYT